jgi:YidC/Oxa1 family membrane protein insertase
MKFIWATVFYNPLYNLLMFFVSIAPGRDLGIAVILLTLLVKIVLFPLSKKAIVSQFKLKLIQPKIDAIKKQVTDKQEQARQTFALYKTEGVNPFSSCLVLLIQLPILFALYYVFLKGIGTIVDTSILYSFIKPPTDVHSLFLGMFDMTKPHIGFGIVAGIAQFAQLWYQPITQEKPANENDMQAMLAYNMTKQMKYVLPIIIIFVSIKLPSALALYWIVSSVVTLIQEQVIKKSLEKHTPVKI